MSSEHARGSDPRHLPARVNPEQTACLIGTTPYYIPVLITAGLLKPLGSRLSRNCVKYFALVEVLRLCADPKWLSKVTDAIHAHDRRKRERRSSGDAPAC